MPITLSDMSCSTVLDTGVWDVNDTLYDDAPFIRNEVRFREEDSE